MHVGIDVEQFLRDPFGSGIQRVLQYLAREWPSERMQADFVVPLRGAHALLTPEQAGALLSIPFSPRPEGSDIRDLVHDAIADMDPVRVQSGDLLAIYDAWLLPEVTYLPEVLTRFALFGRCMPTVMVGYDTLPMTEPANYRFRPGSSAWVSEYFRMLASADSVVCISGYARDSILQRLRRDPAMPISVAHPGGDHLPVRDPAPPARPVFTRLGTMEARKRPKEIAAAFRAAVGEHDAELVFIGSASSSDQSLNEAMRAEVAAGRIRWIEGASDEDVHDLVASSSAFLSIGVEGYGIPVLEAIRLGAPVVYDGIQPAAELMAGRGATRMASLSHPDLTTTFERLLAGDTLGQVRAERQPDAVPTWRAFAHGVADAVAGALR